MSSSRDIFALGLGLQEPWTLLDQHLDTDKQPHEVHLHVGARRRAVPVCDPERLGLATGETYKIKEKLRRVRKAETPQAARWRLTRFLNHAEDMAAGSDALEPVRKAIATVRQQIDRIIQRWHATCFNARLEGLNSILQAARYRARGYSSPTTFVAMIYLLAAPIGDISKSI